jgi:hypothetical protein
MPQNYATHRHTPTLTIVGFVLALLAVIFLIGTWFRPASSALVLGVLCLTAAVFVLLSISRTYTTALQDRIILLEMRLRFREVLPPVHIPATERLSKQQIIALRFASDEELPGLVEQAVAQGLSADAIKRSIKVWRPDLNRT